MRFPPASPAFRAAVPAVLAAGVFAGAWMNWAAWPAPEHLLARAAHGGVLLSGIPAAGVSFQMPLFSVLVAAAFNSGAGPAALFAIIQTALCVLLFVAGRMAGGWSAGTAALAAAAAIELSGRSYDLEQSLYAAALLLVVCMLLRRERDDTARGPVLAGLALGVSILVRPPMLLFPVLLAAASAAVRRGRAALRGEVLFLLASYVLLLPWGFMNLRTGGEFSLVNSVSAADNIISGALGAVYTMEGDAPDLAGLREGASALGFYASRALADPSGWLAGYMRRLAHVFLFHPLLFAAFLAALAVNRERALRPVLALPLYFAAVHAAFSVDPRYFEPMVYVLPPLIGGVFFSARGGGLPPVSRTSSAALSVIFSAALAAAIAVGALALAYPFRASANDAGAAAARLPLDRGVRLLECERAAGDGAHSRASECFSRYALDFGDEGTACALAAAKGGLRGGLPARPEEAAVCLAARMFGALAAGDAELAAAEMEKGLRLYREELSGLRGEPYPRDRELAGLIRGQEAPFWRKYAARALLFRPPGERPALLESARALFPVPLGFGAGERFTREIKPGASRRAKALSDEAVRLMSSGRLAAAGEKLEKALEEHHSFPEALAGLCHFHASSGRPAEAAEACGLAYCAVCSSPSRRRPGLMDLAVEAAGRRVDLLREAGREKSAAEFLRAVSGPPAEDRQADGLSYTIRCGTGGPDPCAGLSFAGEPLE